MDLTSVMGKVVEGAAILVITWAGARVMWNFRQTAKNTRDINQAFKKIRKLGGEDERCRENPKGKLGDVWKSMV